MTAPLSVSASSARAPVRPRRPRTVQAMFFVTAQADPGIAPRLVEPFAKRGLVPVRAHISSEDGDGGTISADLRVRGVSPDTATSIEKSLRAIVGVRQVIARIE